jgi:hypothetical protein
VGTEKKSKPLKYYFLFFIGGFLIFLFYVWEGAEVVTLGYQINGLKEELILLENKNCHLKAKLSAYTNLANIDKIAREERGMISPQNENIVFIKVNFRQNEVSSNRGISIARESSKDAPENSHY